MPDLETILACPRCHRLVSEDKGREAWVCATCGTIGRRTLGFPDFLADQARLAIATDAVIDLDADRTCAERLAEQADRLTFQELSTVATTPERKDDTLSPKILRARERFDANYARIQAEVGMRHGQAILSKLNAYLAETGRGPIRGAWALEAGGGHGLYLPEFSHLFDAVVFLDCSLGYLVLARKLCQECGIHNVALVRGDVTALPFRSGAFDFVHENNVIEHVAAPAMMVKEGLRVTGPAGTYVCVSPNRFTIAPEPHFGLPGFGFFPRWLRGQLIPRLVGHTSEAGVDPRSLRLLRRYFASAGEPRPEIFFLPRQLTSTARNTPLRRTIRSALALPGLGAVASRALNGHYWV